MLTNAQRNLTKTSSRDQSFMWARSPMMPRRAQNEKPKFFLGELPALKWRNWNWCPDGQPPAEKNFGFQVWACWQVRLNQTWVNWGWCCFKNKAAETTEEHFHFQEALILRRPICSKPSNIFKACWVKKQGEAKTKVFFEGSWGLGKCWPSCLHVLMFMEDHLLQKKIWSPKSGHLGKSN